MVTVIQITRTLESGDLSPKQSHAIAEAIELSQRKTQEEVETDLRQWMTDRFLTKEDGARIETKIAEAKADTIKWNFAFWVGLIPVLILIVKYVK